MVRSSWGSSAMSAVVTLALTTAGNCRTPSPMSEVRAPETVRRPSCGRFPIHTQTRPGEVADDAVDERGGVSHSMFNFSHLFMMLEQRMILNKGRLCDGAARRRSSEPLSPRAC